MESIRADRQDELRELVRREGHRVATVTAALSRLAGELDSIKAKHLGLSTEAHAAVLTEDEWTTITHIGVEFTLLEIEVDVALARAMIAQATVEIALLIARGTTAQGYSIDYFRVYTMRTNTERALRNAMIRLSAHDSHG